MPGHTGRSITQLTWYIVPVLILLIPVAYVLLRFSAAHALLGSWTLTVRDQTGAVMGAGTVHWVASGWSYQVQPRSPFLDFDASVIDDGTVTWTPTGAASLRAAGVSGDRSDVSVFHLTEMAVVINLFPNGQPMANLGSLVTGTGRGLSGPVHFAGFPASQATAGRQVQPVWTMDLTR